MASFLILNGPNLNMLGKRDASIYGSKTLDEVKQALPVLISRLERQARSFQSVSCDTHQSMRLGPALGR